MQDDTNIEKLHKTLDDVFDRYEKEHGKLGNDSNFDLFGEYMKNAVVEFNKVNGTNFNPKEIIDKQEEMETPLDELSSYMEEAMENFNNLLK